jgi:hypothetical protein
MKSDAHQFLENLSGDLKTFFTSHGNGPGKAFGSLKDLNAARDHIEKSQHHASMSAEHSDLATTAKGMGNRSIAASHTDASDHHAGLAANHADMAQKHLQKAKSGAAQPLGEGFGHRELDPESLYKPFDPRKSPASRGELDSPRPKHTMASVQDLRNVCNHVAAKYSARVELVRNLGDDVGFVAALTLQPGLYLGTAQPSVSAVEAELVRELRLTAPAALVDLISQDEIANPSGPSSRRGIFRFRLHDLHRDDLGGP